MTRAPLVCLLLFLAATASAQRGEICRFRALDRENPFRRWLGSQEVTCVPAGSQLVFPSGLWNVFVRSDYDISATPLLVDGDVSPMPPLPELVRAAWVTPMLPEGRAGVIYAPRRGSAFPVDRARMTVPADEPLWLFVLNKSAPVAVISIPPLAPETEHAVDGRRGEPPSIVGWLQVPELDRNKLATASGVVSPAVRSGSRAADPLPPPSMLNGAFFLIHDVPIGNAEVRVAGRGWVPDRRVVKVKPGVSVSEAPLIVRAAGTLMLHWSTDQDLPALDRSVGTCEASVAAPRPVIALLKCAGVRGQRPDEMECAPVREETVEDVVGSLTFDDLVPGLYRAEMRFGKLAPVREMRNVNALDITDLRLKAEYVTLNGSVTRGGQPLGEDVRLEFPTGIGFAPADSDEYHAVLRPPPGGAGADVPVTVAPCESEPVVVLTDRPIRPGARLDLDIPANELTVQVSDTFTTERLQGATVKLEAMAKSRPRVVYTKTDTSGEDGNVVWKGVPVRELHLTVTLAGYEKRRVAPFTMLERDNHTVDVQLVPLRGTRGQIVSDRRFDNAQVVWFSPTGSETERADVAPDGTFVFTNWHTPEETMAVVSASHPLWIQRAPAIERRQNLTFRFPAAPAVAFDVWLAAAVPPDVTRYIGVAIGGVRIPQPVLAQHQTLRRDPPLMRAAGPQHFRDLLATGPIEVLLGPTVEEVAGPARSLDIFALPKFAGAPRERLEPGSADVIFTLR